MQAQGRIDPSGGEPLPYVDFSYILDVFLHIDRVLGFGVFLRRYFAAAKSAIFLVAYHLVRLGYFFFQASQSLL